MYSNLWFVAETMHINQENVKYPFLSAERLTVEQEMFVDIHKNSLFYI